MINCDPEGRGEESFFPRCYLLKSGEGCDSFLRNYYYTEAETELRKFIKAFQKGEHKL
jgi:hypothetical protein